MREFDSYKSPMGGRADLICFTSVDSTPNNVGTLKKLNMGLFPVAYSDKFCSLFPLWRSFERAAADVASDWESRSRCADSGSRGLL